MRYNQRQVLLTHEELVELCREWQETLQLQDWTVAVAILRGRDMTHVDNSAQVYYVQRTKEARIAILDPVDYPESNIFPQDMEQALVHELVHLHVAPIWDDESDHEVQGEQAVNCLANALIAAKRAGNRE